MARDYAKMSKCRKIKVGCMIVNNGRIVSTGVNGTPKGTCNCTDHFYAHNEEQFLKEHRDWANEHEVHAEMNALLYAAKSNVEVTSDCILYCTHEPCNNCLKHIAVTGIKQIYYIEKYYNNTQDNKYKIDITQLSLDQDIIEQVASVMKPKMIAYDLVEPKAMPIRHEIIVNARKVIYERDSITFNELVNMCFDNVTDHKLYTADFRYGHNMEFENFAWYDKVMIFDGMQFRCTGSTPVK